MVPKLCQRGIVSKSHQHVTNILLYQSYRVQSATTLVYRGTRVVLKLYQSGVPKWYTSGTEVVPTMYQSGSKVVPTRYQRCIVSKWYQRGIKVVLHHSCSKVVQTALKWYGLWYQSGTKVVPT